MQLGALTVISFAILLCLGFFSGLGIGFVVFWVQFRPKMIALLYNSMEVTENLGIIVEGWENEGENEECPSTN